MRRLSSEEAGALLRAHPRLRNGGGLEGRAGFTLPAFAEGALEIPLEEAVARGDVGVGEVRGQFGPGNRLLLPVEGPYARLDLVFKGAGCENMLFAIDRCAKGSQFRLKITRGDHLMAVAASTGRHNFQVSLRSAGSFFLFGAEGSSNGGNAMVEGPEGRVLVGDDAMFAQGVELRNADSHGIVDLTTGEQLNLPEDVVVGPHVWLAAGATVMKGVSIGRGCVVAAQSVVTADLPDCSLAVGVPARVLRKDVSWTRQTRPDAKKIKELRESLGYR